MLRRFELFAKNNPEPTEAFRSSSTAAMANVATIESTFFITTKMSRFGLSYLLDFYFGGEGSFELTAIPDGKCSRRQKTTRDMTRARDNDTILVGGSAGASCGQTISGG